MGLTMKERRAVTREVAKRYRKATKKQKGEILSEFVVLTGYHRTYASWLLRNIGGKILLRVNGGVVTVVVGQRRKARRQKARKYGTDVEKVLTTLWELSDYLCGKRLAAFLRETVPVLERFGEIGLDDDTRGKLFEISPATIDRLLREEKKKYLLRSRARTRPGTLLKHQIPIRTFSDWDDLRPGFCEMDLVGHDGGDTSGEFAYTLDVTDVCTGWTENRAVKNRAQKWTFEALEEIEQRLPFPLSGLDSDNDSAFINAHLKRYCNKKKITFTRSRAGRKNDNCYVEQKNYSIVRRNVGYARYDTEEELTVLNELYDHLRLYVNFFLPVMKLREKTRTGSKVTKKYDTPNTPYLRILRSKDMDGIVKRRLRKQYKTLNPAELRRTITKLQNRLLDLTASKKIRRRKGGDFVYNFHEATNTIS